MDRIVSIIQDIQKDLLQLVRIAHHIETLPGGKSYVVLDKTTDGPLDSTELFVVPPGHYFMMGDNRDNSDDSRYWGFVPDDHIRGKAILIWFNWDDISSLAFKRVGTGIR